MSVLRRCFLLITVLSMCVMLPASGSQPMARLAHAQEVISAPADVEPNTAAGARPQATRGDKWLTPTAAPDDVMGPDQHDLQRNDPAEGIPAHAYSPFDERRNREHPCPPGGCESMKGQVLVKLTADVPTRKAGGPGALTADAGMNAALAGQGIIGLEPIFPAARPPAAGALAIAPDGSAIPLPDLTRWQRATLGDASADVHAVAESLTRLPGIAWAEPDYLRKPVGDERPKTNDERPTDWAGASSLVLRPSSFSDPLYAQQWHLAATHVPEAWQWLTDHGLPPGGNRDIVVAVIDTGVDLNHPDLAANLWTNSREIPGNGMDDDGNGYVDDVHGADMITNSGNPMDDHGHGTHVAGIIAAQAGNGIGGVGVAYNTQIMAIKAAQYSGVLASSDIAEGIYYAVAQGADVINMSFGGYARSQVEEDALAVAFGQAVLVAAAGNDGKVNLPCPLGRDMYPAAYNWVLGVMASTSGGGRASFSNYDCTPHDSHEYELMAPGVDVWSTLPNKQYAAWDGTSMAAPVVSGIAALTRTKWADKDVYSSRFIMGQIAANAAGGTGGVADAYTALIVAPQPELSYLEHWLFDTAAQSATNDDDGIVDAGETIDLAIVIRNHWGKADPVSAKLEAWAEGAYQADPYVTMITGTVDYGAVGSFNIDDNGLIYDDQGVITGVRNPFRFTVDPNTPNDHVIPFRLTMTAGNGYDPADPNAPYTFVSQFYLIVQRGRELPHIIDHDMTLTKDDFWLMSKQTLIGAGANVTITQGTQIQFWSADPNDPYSQSENVFLQVEGSLLARGTIDEPIEMFNSPLRFAYPTTILQMSMGNVDIQYARIQNPLLGGSPVGMGILNRIDTAYINEETSSYVAWPRTADIGQYPAQILAHDISRTILYRIGSDCLWFDVRPLNLASRYELSLFDTSVLGSDPSSIIEVTESVLLKNSRPARSRPECSVNENSKIYGGGYTCVGCDENVGRTANSFRNNAILNTWWNSDVSSWLRFYSSRSRGSVDFITDNYWGTTSSTLINACIQDTNDDFNMGLYIYQPILTTVPTTTYPFVVDVAISTSASLHTQLVRAEPVTFTVIFNRDMNPSVQPAVSFGPDVPMTDYTIHPINGGWADARTWQGTFNITPVTGDGYQLIRVAGAVAANDPWLVTGDDAGRFRFEIITSGTEAMNLQATGGEGRVDLSWTQTDFDLLAGFNLYRATAQDGTYSRVNTSIIPPETRAYTDTAVTPGTPYYYKFTVVKSDMTESDYSNVAQGTPLDTIPPTLSHTPVTSAPPGLPLTLFADVTDNVVVRDVILRYRAIGATAYSSQAMAHTTGNRYSATIAGAQVTAPGIEYYIEATDGISTVQDGRPEYPHVVAVVDRPVVTAVSPNRGPASGGTVVTIAGSNFKPGAAVTFGAAAAGAVTVVNSSQITCTTPAHYPAAADVVVTNPGDATGSLLRGFTFESDTASLSLPATGGEQHAIVQVPVNAANVQGLLAAALTITFDNNILHARGARTGSLTPGWSLEANTGTPGQVRLTMASSGTVAGSGVLAYLEFEVVGAAGTNSALQFAAVSLNDGAIPAQTSAGSFAVNQAYSVAGTVRTWNGGAGVPGVNLSLAGDRLYTGLTDGSGAYLVTGALQDDYVLTPSKSDGVNGISAYDASLALQHAAGLTTLAGSAFTAADVDKSGAVTSLDAAYILQKAVNLITLPFPGAGVVWDFTPRSRSYTNLSSNQTGQDFTAILIGDPSGNWTAGGASAARIAGAAAGEATLTLGSAEVAPGQEVTVPLSLALTDAQVHGLDLAVSFDPDVLTPLRATTTALTENFGQASNARTPGQLRLALAGSRPIATNGQVLNLTFLARGTQGMSSTLRISASQLDEGAITAHNTDGRITIGTGISSLPLATGWNLIAIPRTLADPGLPTALNAIAGQYSLVYAYDGCDPADPWKRFDPNMPAFGNDLTSLNVQRGYWLRGTQAGILNVAGTFPGVVSIALCPGWNLIGYPSAAPVALPDALASIAGKYDLVYAYDASDAADPWKKYDPSVPFFVNDLTAMGPGMGYWLRMKEAATLNVP